MSKDLKQLTGALGLEKPFLVGHSMGATVIVLAHVTCGLAASGIVLIEPIFLPPEAYRMALSVDTHPLAAKAVKRRNAWRDRQAAYDDFKAKPFFKAWDDEVLDLYIAHGLCDGTADGADSGVQLTCSPQHEAALFMGGVKHDPWPLMPRVACPTLVVEGQNSEIREWIDLKGAAEHIPGGRHIVVDGAGHLIPMEQPAVIGRLIESFIRCA